MVAQTTWCELCRFDDLLLARAVATSIASMEFDVRLCEIGAWRGDADDAPGPGRPPFVVQVDHRQVLELAEVLDEIVQEQRDFDCMLADRARAQRPARIMAVVTITGAAELLLLLALMDW